MPQLGKGFVKSIYTAIKVSRAVARRAPGPTDCGSQLAARSHSSNPRQARLGSPANVEHELIWVGPAARPDQPGLGRNAAMTHHRSADDCYPVRPPRGGWGS